jgi:hypothetical protein
MTSASVDYVKFIGAGGNDRGNFITTDSNNNVYVTGYVNGVSGEVITINGSGYAKTGTGDDVFIVKYDSSGNVVYVNFIGGSSYDICNSITTDSYNNVYVTGYVGGGSTPITIGNTKYTTNDGADCAFIVKFDSNGDVVYFKFIGGGGYDVGNSITTDSNNNVYVTGYFGGSAGALITIDGSGYAKTDSGDDAFIVKYDSSGVVKYVKFIGGSSSDVGNSITTDSNNNVYVTGVVFGNANTLITIDGSGYVKPSADADTFIVKYNSSGNVVYVKFIGGGGTDRGNSITTDSNNNVYVTGFLPGNTLITIDGSGYATPTNNNYAFIIKYDSSGSVVYVKFIGSNGGPSAGNSITTDSYNNVYVTGVVSGSANKLIIIDGSGYAKPSSIDDVFIVKYDSSGVVKYVKFIGGSGGDVGNSITTDSNNNVYVTGYVSGGTGTLITIDGSGYAKPGANNDAFIVKYRQNVIIPVATYNPIYSATTSQQFTITPTNVSNVSSVSISPPIANATINQTTGEIVGTISSPSSIPYTVTLTAPGGVTAQKTFTLTITAVSANEGGGSTSPEISIPSGINFRLPIELDSSGHVATLNAQGELVTYNAIDFAVQYDASGALSVSQLRNTIRYKEDASNAAKVDVTVSGEVIRGLLETGLQSSSLKSFWDDALTGPAAIPLSSISGEGAKYFQDSANVAVNGSISGTMMANYLRRHVYNFIIGQVGLAGVSSGIGAAAELGVIDVNYDNTDASQIATKLVDKLVASDETGAFIRQSIYEQMLNLDVNRFVGATGDHANGRNGEGIDSAYRQVPFAVNDSLSFLITFKFGNMALGQSNNPFTGPNYPVNDPINYVSPSGKITVIDSDADLSTVGLSNLTAIFKVKFTN